MMTQNHFGHNLLKRFPNPLYSPDISPSDFGLFGKVKVAMTARESSYEIDLLEAATEILNSISDAEL
jgi:hypothetical protein